MNLATANTEVYPSKTLSKNVTFSHLFLGRVLTREDLCFGIVAHDNNFNSSETDHASTPLGIFASKSVSCKTNIGGVGTPPYVAISKYVDRYLLSEMEDGFTFE